MSYLQYTPPPSPHAVDSDHMELEALDHTQITSVHEIVQSNDTAIYDPWVTPEDQR